MAITASTQTISAAIAAVTPLASSPPDWNSEPAWKLPGWAEPVIVASILFYACFWTRRKHFSVFGNQPDYRSLLDANDSEDLSSSDSNSPVRLNDGEESFVDSENNYSGFISTSEFPSKRRSWCGTIIYTPNSSRFSKNVHSRILHKFPFLMEMFYWIITYFIYRLTHIFSQEIFSDSIWETAQENALRVLDVEQFSFLRFLFPMQEVEVQQWFMDGHDELLTFLNRTYALIHIPGSVFFIAWYYHSAATHAVFAIVRRTVTLCNLLAFSIFTVYPCMPPRLLPEEYGFIDSVRRDKAESVWMNGKFANQLAAMPSMHFGYSFMIGMTLVYHSGVFSCLGFGYHGKKGKALHAVNLGKWWQVWFCTLGIVYPVLILITIVATANHYWLDACVAALVAGVSLALNRVFMVFVPLEDLLLWVLRIEKPKPNCGSAPR
ncbi:hypothetical protein RUND412_011144 [Rhizina undulata]